MLIRLDLSSKFTFPTLMLGLVATLAVEGMENSRRVFLAIASKMMGALEMGSCAGRIAEGGMTQGRDLLTSFSGFSVYFPSWEKPVIHYPYLLPNKKSRRKHKVALA